MPILFIPLAFVFLGQFLNAVIVLIDKHIITTTSVSSPSAYSFYVGFLSIAVLFILPFGVVHIPSVTIIWLSLAIGLSFIGSILFLFRSLKIASATDVVPWLGAVTTIVTFLLNFIFLDEHLPSTFPYALIFFVIGMSLVGHFRFNAKSFSYIVISAILFGFSSVLLKMLLDITTVMDGFFWSRMGNVVAALCLLLWPPCRRAVFQSSKESTHKTTFLIVINRILGGVAFLFIFFAIQGGSVSLVNALGSLQFLFLFLLIVLLKNRMPEQFEHEFRPGHVAHKMFAMIFILIGFFVLFI
jgi:uncharacterized membrane protein